jgi:hypothetical protein
MTKQQEATTIGKSARDLGFDNIFENSRNCSNLTSSSSDPLLRTKLTVVKARSEPISDSLKPTSQIPTSPDDYSYKRLLILDPNREVPSRIPKPSGRHLAVPPRGPAYPHPLKYFAGELLEKEYKKAEKRQKSFQQRSDCTGKSPVDNVILFDSSDMGNQDDTSQSRRQIATSNPNWWVRELQLFRDQYPNLSRIPRRQQQARNENVAENFRLKCNIENKVRTQKKVNVSRSATYKSLRVGSRPRPRSVDAAKSRQTSF